MKTIKFIEKAKLKHGIKYDYSLVEYVGSHEKINIICTIHGVFNQSPTNHLSGNGCPKCSGKNKTTKEFINEIKLIHGDKYDYSKVEYIKNKSKIKIICPVHDEFEQSAINHLRGNGCPKCVNKNVTNEEFINKAKLKHGDKYGYTILNNGIKIICPVHGEFEQRFSHHINGCGCPKCVNKNVTNEEFINKAKLKHGDKYDYSLVEYIKNKTKVKIICPIHGAFQQTPSSHLSGKGCPICKESKGEREIRVFLIENKIDFIPQYKFPDCKYKRQLPFDFYLPDYNMCIEYQGEQHYKKVEIWGGEENFNKIKERDKIKMEYCKNNNIPLIKINYKENAIDKLLTFMSF